MSSPYAAIARTYWRGAMWYWGMIVILTTPAAFLPAMARGPSTRPLEVRFAILWSILATSSFVAIVAMHLKEMLANPLGAFPPRVRERHVLFAFSVVVAMNLVVASTGAAVHGFEENWLGAIAECFLVCAAAGLAAHYQPVLVACSMGFLGFIPFFTKPGTLMYELAVWNPSTAASLAMIAAGGAGFLILGSRLRKMDEESPEYARRTALSFQEIQARTRTGNAGTPQDIREVFLRLIGAVPAETDFRRPPAKTIWEKAARWSMYRGQANAIVWAIYIASVLLFVQFMMPADGTGAARLFGLGSTVVSVAGPVLMALPSRRHLLGAELLRPNDRDAYLRVAGFSLLLSSVSSLALITAIFVAAAVLFWGSGSLNGDALKFCVINAAELPLVFGVAVWLCRFLPSVWVMFVFCFIMGVGMMGHEVPARALASLPPATMAGVLVTLFALGVGMIAFAYRSWLKVEFG